MEADLLQKGLLTIKDVGKVMGWSPEIAYKRITRGEIPGTCRLGGRIYVKGPVLRAWLERDDERETTKSHR